MNTIYCSNEKVESNNKLPSELNINENFYIDQSLKFLISEDLVEEDESVEGDYYYLSSGEPKYGILIKEANVVNDKVSFFSLSYDVAYIKKNDSIANSIISNLLTIYGDNFRILNAPVVGSREKKRPRLSWQCNENYYVELSFTPLPLYKELIDQKKLALSTVYLIFGRLGVLSSTDTTTSEIWSKENLTLLKYLEEE